MRAQRDSNCWNTCNSSVVLGVCACSLRQHLDMMFDFHITQLHRSRKCSESPHHFWIEPALALCRLHATVWKDDEHGGFCAGDGVVCFVINERVRHICANTLTAWSNFVWTKYTCVCGEVRGWAVVVLVVGRVNILFIHTQSEISPLARLPQYEP